MAELGDVSLLSTLLSVMVLGFYGALEVLCHFVRGTSGLPALEGRIFPWVVDAHIVAMVTSVYCASISTGL